LEQLNRFLTKTAHYKSSTLDTSAALRRCADAGSSPEFTFKGNLGILDSTLIGFFCSVRCPGDALLKTYDLAQMLRDTDAAIVGGFQSPMEKECLDLLLRGSASTVVCPARGLDRMRVLKKWQEPLAKGHLLILSFFADRIRRPTTAVAAQRNAHIAALADRILVAHAAKGGKTEALCKEALTAGKPVFAIDSPDNAHLVKLGIVPIQAETLAPLL